MSYRTDWTWSYSAVSQKEETEFASLSSKVQAQRQGEVTMVQIGDWDVELKGNYTRLLETKSQSIPQW